jgi:Glycosyltransferase family 87/WD40-like Beta Propeller Repeat
MTDPAQQAPLNDARRARWLTCVEWLAVVGLGLAFLWKGFRVGWATLNSDFPNYYLGGTLFRGGWPLERLNDWIWMQRQKDHLGLDQALVGYLPSTLWSTLLIVPLTWLPPLAAKRVWLIVNLLLLLGVAELLHRLTRLPYRRIALVVLLAVVPLRTNFQFGQQHLVVLFLLTLATWAHFRERPALSGLALALAAALKLYPALFVLYFIRKRRWRALVALSGSSVALLVLGVALFGVEPLREYALRILPRSLKGEFNDPYITNLNSLTAWLRRLFAYEPDLNPAPLVRAPWVFVLTQPVAQALIMIAGLWALDPGHRSIPVEKQKLDWAAFCALLLLLSTGTSTYHLCALIMPLALGVDYFLDARQGRRAWLVVLIGGLACLPYGRLLAPAPSGWRILLGFPRLYALLALWVIFVHAAWRVRAIADGPRGRAEIARWSLGFAAWAGVSLASSVSHFDGQFANYAARLPVGAQPLIATTPGSVGSDLFFTRMDADGYVVDRLDRPIGVEAPRAGDLFFPTATAASDDAWIELASTTSRIVRFPRAATHLKVSDLAVEVEDAQQPVISPDARWLAFVRERAGRGSLWVLDRRAPPGADARPAPPHPLLEAGNDVLDFGFLPDDRIVLASYENGRSTLAVIDPGSGQLVPFPTSDRSVRYPAASPDGRWLAYSEQQRGQWQLWTMNLESRQRRQLTFADCNSVMPSWSVDSQALVYASDCGRGLGHTALCRIAAHP